MAADLSSASHDVLVIGGGPAGSAAAAVLAERGRRVLLLEKETFPRYHVGESLTPFCWYPLERLGLLEKMESAAFVVRKHAVQFVGLDGRVSTPFYFFEHTRHDSARTWQVVRSDFDRMLLDHAAGKGVTVMQGTTAKELIREDGTVTGVRAEDPHGRLLDLGARLTIDASGRDAFAQLQNGWRIQDRDLRKMAIWTYYRGAKRDPGIDEGTTTVAYLPEKGWFWYIALPDDVVSVGVVAEPSYLYWGPRDPEHIFHRERLIQPWIRDRLDPGRPLQPCQVTGDFTYRARHCAADGLLLTGDAFSFIDPVFSSGVCLALQGGVLAGEAVDAALAADDVSASRFADYGRQLCQGIEAMRGLVHAFYDTTFHFGEFLKIHPELRHDLTDCLIGNLFRDFGPLFEAVREFADLPAPLPHGGPAL